MSHEITQPAIVIQADRDLVPAVRWCQRPTIRVRRPQIWLELGKGRCRW